ncbi:coth protein-domain-containing protein [Fennellomyces sp. T-0311]|nr:coth protein-domain-containing protein [Fennellomyces sp. T-0311]
MTAFLSSEAQEIQYRVLAPPFQSEHSLAVIVDNETYPLSRSSATPLLYTGNAPVAEDSYHYVKTMDGAVVEHEYVTRSSVDEDTVYQFYNRSRDEWNITPLPQVMDPLSEINRIESDLHVYGEIPTIHFLGNQTEIDHMHTNIFDDYQTLTEMVYIRGDELQTFKDVELELAGRGSRFSPKLSYNIKIPKESGETLYGYRRMKLRALFSDPSYLRESLAYAAIKSTGLASSDFSYARVFINNETAGFFGVIENYKNPWFRNEFGDGDDDYSQGNAYQGMVSSEAASVFNHTSDLSYYGDNVTAYADGQYKIKEDPSEGEPDFRPLMELTKFLSEAPTESDDAVEQWEQHFNMDSVLRSMALEVLLGYSDGYIAMIDNYYLYQDGVDSQRFIYIPSDLDLTFGSTMIKLTDMLSGDYRTYPGLLARPLTSQFLRVPQFKEQYETLLKDLVRELVNPDIMNPFIDDTAEMIREDVTWDWTLPPLSRFNFSQIDEEYMDENGLSVDQWPWPVDKDTIADMFFGRYKLNITFDLAVNGPTGSISLTGVKEFVANQSRATAEFFETHHG